MLVSGERERSGRKGQYSCDFCRTRKLRCDRPLPCTSCKSRGKTCHFGPGVTAPRGPTVESLPAQQARPQVQSSPTLADILPPPLPPPQLQTQPQPPSQEDLLAEIQALRRLMHDLENRVVQSTAGHQRRQQYGSDIISSPRTPIHTDLGYVSNVVDHLQRVSMGQSSLEPIYSDDIVFKIERIRAIPHAPTYTAQLSKPILCVWLPLHDEAKVLVDSYITELSYIQHVVHHPSLPATIDDAYRQIEGHEPVKPGHLVLLLSIIACATHVWAPRDPVDGGRSLFLSSAQANAQTPLWIKATHAVLNAAQNSTALALETVQGIIILSFVISNLEGVSVRFRSLMATGLMLGRELGLHRIDHESNAAVASTLQVEMGRRVWWYLVATDWLLAARYGGPGEGVYQTHPRHMTVNKPRNINDMDLVANELQLELPMSQPTDVSYLLQRIRLAEISRSIVDHNLMSATSSSRSSYYAHVMAMDFELDQMMRSIPPFFQLDSYERGPDSNKSSSIYIQAYMLNIFMHTQRCKLHLTYLTSEPNNNPTYASSRHICLMSARHIIRAEGQLLRSQHPFVRVRLRLAAILHSVFMASIVLLMDACVNRPSLLQDEILHGDVAEALRIIDGARSYSLAAANLHESLMQILANHRVQQLQQQQQQRQPTPSVSAPNMEFPYPHPRRDSSAFITSPSHRDMERVSSTGAPPDQAFSQPTQGLEETMHLNDTQWDDLFSNIVSSSFL